MDFFSHQDDARRKTSVLLVYFGLSVIAIIIAMYMVFTFLFFTFSFKINAQPLQSAMFWDGKRFAVVSCAALIIIICGSLYKITALKNGGSQVAEMLGGRVILPNSTDLKERRLLNVVEEMAIASGVGVPMVYVMNNETSINAFAAGFDLEDAVVSVTRGTLDNLNRDELQGVIAHEFSHIFNGDMRLNIRLLGILHGILVIALIGRAILRGLGRARSKKSGQAAIFGVALYVMGYIGVFFGKLIKSAVSRQREYLADASAVQFTRNPDGLSGALKKIGGLVKGSRISHYKAEEISHMFFGNGLRESFLSSFSTHPPIEERVQRIDPHFDGVFPKISLKISDEEKKKRIDNATQPFALTSKRPEISEPVTAPVSPDRIMQSIGAPLNIHMDMAQDMLASLPILLLESAREPFGSRADVYSLLLDDDSKMRAGQLEILKENADPAVFAETQKLLKFTESLSPEMRLPLLDLALPALKTLSLEQYQVFMKNVDALIGADKKVDLFEYTLRHIIKRHLAVVFEEPEKKVTLIYSVRGVENECSCVLSTLARVGHKDKQQAAAAFKKAVGIIMVPQADLSFLQAQECGLKQLDESLDRLARVSPLLKKKLVAACLQSLVYDEKINVREMELFRAVAEALNCPVPPLA